MFFPSVSSRKTDGGNILKQCVCLRAHIPATYSVVVSHFCGDSVTQKEYLNNSRMP